MIEEKYLLDNANSMRHSELSDMSMHMAADAINTTSEHDPDRDCHHDSGSPSVRDQTEGLHRIIHRHISLLYLNVIPL